MVTIAVICSVVAILISLVCLPIAIIALVELRSFNKSTHRVEFMPAPTPNGQDVKSIMEGLDADSFIGNRL